MNLRRMIENVCRGVRDLADEVSRPLNLALAFCLSPLPRRYWRGATGGGILLSGLFQVGGSLAGLVHTYTAYAQRVSDALADATIAAAVASGSEKISATPAMAFGALTPFGFFAVSVPAWVFAYGLFSGLIRVLGYAADHPCGDPILTFIDDLVLDAGRALKASVRRIVARLGSRWRG